MNSDEIPSKKIIDHSRNIASLERQIEDAYIDYHREIDIAARKDTPEAWSHVLVAKSKYEERREIRNAYKDRLRAPYLH